MGILEYAKIYPGRTTVFGLFLVAVISAIYWFIDFEALGFSLPSAESFGQTLLVSIISLLAMLFMVGVAAAIGYLIWSLYSIAVYHTAIAWYQGKRREEERWSAQHRQDIDDYRDAVEKIQRKVNVERPNVTEEVIKSCL